VGGEGEENPGHLVARTPIEAPASDLPDPVIGASGEDEQRSGDAVAGTFSEGIGGGSLD
jgi:hypothetical protein